MNTDETKNFQPIEVTDALRKEYEALSLTQHQGQTILGNSTTHIVIKPLPPGLGTDRSDG